MTEPQVLPLATPLGNRYTSSTVDAKLVNCFAEAGVSKEELFVYKRPGFKYKSTIAPGTARGLYNWKNDLYAIIDGSLYKNGASISGAINNAGVYSFAPCLGATPKLFFKNSTNAYEIGRAHV